MWPLMYQIRHGGVSGIACDGIGVQQTIGGTLEKRSSGPDGQSPHFEEQPPHHHPGHIDLAKLNESRQPVRAEGVRHRGRGSRGVPMYLAGARNYIGSDPSSAKNSRGRQQHRIAGDGQRHHDLVADRSGLYSRCEPGGAVLASRRRRRGRESPPRARLGRWPAQRSGAGHRPAGTLGESAVQSLTRFEVDRFSGR